MQQAPVMMSAMRFSENPVSDLNHGVIAVEKRGVSLHRFYLLDRLKHELYSFFANIRFLFPSALKIQSDLPSSALKKGLKQ